MLEHWPPEATRATLKEPWNVGTMSALALLVAIFAAIEADYFVKRSK
jgi:hypothetical protein